MLPLKVTTLPATSTRRISIPRDKLTHESFVDTVQGLLKVKDASVLEIKMCDFGSDVQNTHIINSGEALRKALQLFDASGGACMHLVARTFEHKAAQVSTIGISVRI